MTKASKFLQEIYGYGNAYTPVPSPVGTQSNNAQYVPNPNDAKLGTYNQMDIEDQAPLAQKIGNIIDSLDDNDITDDLADIVESYLGSIDPGGDMAAGDAALMLPLEDCQDLYEELTKYLDDNNIDYSEDESDYDLDMPFEVPSDQYPTAGNYIMGKGDGRGGSFKI